MIQQTDDWPSCGATVYVAGIFVDRPPPSNLELICGTSSAVDEGTVYVSFIRQGVLSEICVPRSNVFPDEHSARKRLLAMRLYYERRGLLERVPGIVEAYPMAIRHTQEARLCGNPLRAGEPGVAFFAQSNAWGREDNAQKCLMIAGSIWQDIHALFSLLYVVSLASDYAKKMVGKYIVIEMQSLRDVLGRLSKLEHRYLPLFKNLRSNLGRLDQEFGLPRLRNKLGAHRDGDLDVMQLTQFWKKLTRYNLQRHLDVFAAHFGEMNSLFGQEMVQYFRPPEPMPNLTPARMGHEGNDDWEPFDPPRFSEHSEF